MQTFFHLGMLIYVSSEYMLNILVRNSVLSVPLAVKPNDAI